MNDIKERDKVFIKEEEFQKFNLGNSGQNEELRHVHRGWDRGSENIFEESRWIFGVGGREKEWAATEYETSTLLTKPVDEAYLSHKFEIPKLPSLKLESKDKVTYFEYHECRGNSKENCSTMKNKVEHLVRKGELDKYKDWTKVKFNNLWGVLKQSRKRKTKIKVWNLYGPLEPKQNWISYGLPGLAKTATP